MKKHLLKPTLFCLVIITSLLGCKREAISPSNEFLELKIFYNKNLPSEQNIFKNTKPIWSKVEKLEFDGSIVYEVSMQNPDKVGVISKALAENDIANYENTHALKLLLFVDSASGNVTKGCYMAVEANSIINLEKVHYKEVSLLTGQVVYYHLNGMMSNGVNYLAGKPMYKINSLQESALTHLNKQNNGTLANHSGTTVQGCSTYYVETGYVGCVGAGNYENCQWYSTGYSSYTICDGGNTKLRRSDEDYLGDGGSSGGGSTGSSSNSINAEDPGYAYELTVIADSIKLASRFNCFNSVPDNAATIYKATLYAELADKDRPGALLSTSLTPGHTFVTITKTNGTNTVSETFGFYPKSSMKASIQVPTKSMMVDNQGHDYNASLAITINATQFTSMINTAITKAQRDYNMTGYNCTNYALDVFNQGMSTPLYVPSNIGTLTGFNYGKTPSGVYETIKNMQATGVAGASIGLGKGISSTLCN